MTTPVVTPSKMKAVIALVGSLLSAAIPFVLQYSTALPTPWPALIGGVVALLTMLGVYHAPYAPTGTVLKPTDSPAPATPPQTPSGNWVNPWRNR